MTDPVMLLSQVHGEGRVTFRALRAAGFYTLAGVAEASINLLSERAHLSVQTARRLKAGAEEMLDRGLGSPDQDEPPKTSPARARSARGPRFASRETSALSHGPPPPTLTAGISIEEALLLSGTWETTPEPFLTTVSAPAPTPAPPPVSGARLPEMAAAAEAAASLVRMPATDRPPAPPRPAPAEPPVEERPEPGKTVRGTGETFWSFG